MNIKESNNDDGRKPLDASLGKDRIEIEKMEAQRLNDMGKFAPMGGDLGDESRDKGDLPIQERKNQNEYDPAMGTGGTPTTDGVAGQESMYVTQVGSSGITNKKGDGYVDEDGDKKVAEEKRKNKGQKDGDESS